MSRELLQQALHALEESWALNTNYESVEEKTGHEFTEARTVIAESLKAVESIRAYLAVPAVQPVMAGVQAAQHYDDFAVDQFAKMMKAKLAKKRAEGRGGWDDPEQCSIEFLNQLLLEHVAKGDPVDVANLCMMLRHYDANIVAAPVAPAKLPKWIDDKKGRDPFMDDVIQWIEKNIVPVAPVTEPQITVRAGVIEFLPSTAAFPKNTQTLAQRLSNALVADAPLPSTDAGEE